MKWVMTGARRYSRDEDRVLIFKLVDEGNVT